MERRVRIDLAYDGTAFSGWQVQPRRPTVQGALEAALGRLHGGTPVAVRGAGRTDAGVHARGQVADALVSDRFDDALLLRGLRGVVPGQISVGRVQSVPESFHARNSATAKTYGYLVDRSHAPDPFLARFALHAPAAADHAAIDAALAALRGSHDFRGFSAAACTVEDRVRTLHEARRIPLRRSVDLFRFSADGFLMHMVRILVGTVLAVGRGRFPAERIDEVLTSGNRALAGATAPPHGLCLERVVYPEALGGASGLPEGIDLLW